MRILVVAATHAEVKPILNYYKLPEGDFLNCGWFDLLITGVGMTATGFALGNHLKAGYTLALNLGIAGSFDPGILPGTVVNVREDIFSELGAQDGETFLPIDALGFGRSKFNGIMVPGLLPVKGITVNTVHGNASAIAEIRERYNPETESMEGAAVFYCCEQAGLPCLQVRSISNFIERRNREKWAIDTAIRNLNEWAINFLDQHKTNPE